MTKNVPLQSSSDDFDQSGGDPVHHHCLSFTAEHSLLLPDVHLDFAADSQPRDALMDADPRWLCSMVVATQSARHHMRTTSEPHIVDPFVLGLRYSRNAGLSRSRKVAGRKKPLPDRHTNALINDVRPIADMKLDERGVLQGAFHTWGRNETIRSAESKALQTVTALNKTLGACHRCRGQKKRCIPISDIFGCCKNCASVSRLSLARPCVRIEIQGLLLHRQGSTIDDKLDNWFIRQVALARRQEELDCLDLGVVVPRTHVVTITQDRGASFDVTVRTFQPEQGDATSFKWTDVNGFGRKMEMPPYCIWDTQHAMTNMIQAANQHRGEYIASILQGDNPIIMKTFEAALHYLDSSKSTLVADALTFWVATRFIELPWRVCHGSLPEFEPLHDPSCPWSGIIPVTPIMDTQIDHMAVKGLLLPLGRKILLELEKKAQTKKREDWFEIYLATFVTMNNFEFIFADVLAYTTRHGIKARKKTGLSLSLGFYQACKTILAYFHFACSGNVPLSLSLLGPQLSHDVLSLDQVAYIRDVQQELARQSDKRNGWRTGSMYVTPMYWCFQIFERKWDGAVKHAGLIDGFTEEDFLTS